MALYSCVCSCPKISRNVYLYLFTFLVLILQSTCFICTIWKRKQTMEQQPLLLFDLVHKQCNNIIKGWHHCLRSESKRRFLVNKILLLSGHSANPIFFNKKKKNWRPEDSPTSPPPMSDFISFLPPPPPPSSKYVHMFAICVSPLGACDRLIF